MTGNVVRFRIVGAGKYNNMPDDVSREIGLNHLMPTVPREGDAVSLYGYALLVTRVIYPVPVSTDGVTAAVWLRSDGWD